MQHMLYSLQLLNYQQLTLGVMGNLYQSEFRYYYYSLKGLSEYVDVLLIPYNFIINKDIRDSMNLKLTNNVIIFDEGHNLKSSLLDTLSTSFSFHYLSSALVRHDAQGRTSATGNERRECRARQPTGANRHRVATSSRWRLATSASSRSRARTLRRR